MMSAEIIRWGYSTAVCFALSFVFVSTQDDECPAANKPKTLNAEMGNSKLFMTPGFYRGVYPPNADCHWIIRSPGPQTWIQLNIHYSHTEDRLFTECDDFIEIRDGPSSNSPVLLKWCGYFNPSAFSSMADGLYVRFKSDQYFEDGRGLNMSYVAYARPGCPPGWRESSSTGDCYRLVSPQPPYSKLSWLDAQKRCSYERGNLVTVSSDEERTEVFGFYGSSSEQPWVGVNDAQEEGKFVSIDPNSKLYPDPLHPSGTGGNRHCVYVDLMHGGQSMYGVDECRAERSYLCQRRIDGTTLPYPPPEAVIKNSLIGSASVSWHPAYLWLLILVILLLLLLACAPFIRKRYKQYKANRVAAQSETASGNMLIRNNTTPNTPNAPNPNCNNGTTGANAQHLPPPSNLILAYDNIRIPTPEKKPVESAVVVGTANDSIGHTNRKMTGNGTVARGSHVLVPMAPVEKFDRPIIRALDNVSAISMDEFWHKIETERIRNINVAESPPAEHY